MASGETTEKRALNLDRTRRILADLFGYEHAILFGRARSSIVALFEILGTHRDFTFAIPSNVCPPILVAGIGAGAQVKLAPVDPMHGLASDSALAKAVEETKGTGVVMPTHLYGFVQDYPRTIETAKRRGWFVLENDCLATKARSIQCHAEGAFGDGLVVSFGPGKTLDAAGGGGAFLTNDPVLANELERRALLYPAIDQIAHDRELSIVAKRRRLMNERASAAPDAPMVERLLFEELGDLRYRFTEELEAPLLHAIEGFGAKVGRRRERLSWWERALQSCGERAPAPALAQPAPWRAIRRVPKVRDRVVAGLRASGFDAGTNYQSLRVNFPILLERQCFDDAESWGAEVLNLWVSDNYDRERIQRASDIIKRCLDG